MDISKRHFKISMKTKKFKEVWNLLLQTEFKFSIYFFYKSSLNVYFDIKQKDLPFYDDRPSFTQPVGESNPCFRRERAAS